MADLRGELAGRLQYFAGHSDTLGLFADGDFLRRAAAGVADPFREADVHKVAGIEARGFVLAACVALELRAGRRRLGRDREQGADSTPADPSVRGVYAGLSLLVDQLPDAVRDELEPVAAVAVAAEVGG